MDLWLDTWGLGSKTWEINHLLTVSGQRQKESLMQGTNLNLDQIQGSMMLKQALLIHLLLQKHSCPSTARMRIAVRPQVKGGKWRNTKELSLHPGTITLTLHSLENLPGHTHHLRPHPSSCYLFSTKLSLDFLVKVCILLLFICLFACFEALLLAAVNCFLENSPVQKLSFSVGS